MMARVSQSNIIVLKTLFVRAFVLDIYIYEQEYSYSYNIIKSFCLSLPQSRIQTRELFRVRRELNGVLNGLFYTIYTSWTIYLCLYYSCSQISGSIPVHVHFLYYKSRDHQFNSSLMSFLRSVEFRRCRTKVETHCKCIMSLFSITCITITTQYIKQSVTKIGLNEVCSRCSYSHILYISQMLLFLALLSTLSPLILCFLGVCPIHYSILALLSIRTILVFSLAILFVVLPHILSFFFFLSFNCALSKARAYFSQSILLKRLLYYC